MALVGSIMDELEKPWNRLVIVTADDAKVEHDSVFGFIEELHFRLSGDFEVDFVGPDDEDYHEGDRIILTTRPIKEHVIGRRIYIVPEESYIKTGLRPFRVRPSK